MRISNIKLNNFRIYKGQNELNLLSRGNKNISIIAGKNGFGKTTFLTSLIWCFYGKLMTQVEDKYKKDIRNIGGYDNYLLSLINRDVKDESSNASFSVEVELKDLLIPSIPCRTVSIKRSYSLDSKEETLQILIDGDENELTKEVGFEVFVNDFILPREIAKFFFFDAEKIVSLAEAKSKTELRSLSKAYSEVLGIKKYEELKNNLESLLTKLRRRGVSEHEEFKLKELLSEEDELEKIISHNQDKQDEIDKHIVILKSESDSLQEKLIREGNSITLEELKDLKSRRDVLKQESTSIKQELRKLLDLVPLVIAGKHLGKFYSQLVLENDDLFGAVTEKILKKELQSFSKSILANEDLLSLDPSIKDKIEKAISNSIKSKFKTKDATSKVGKVYLEFNEESFREFEAIYNNIKTTFLSQFNAIVKEEKVNKALLSRTIKKIKQGEARKDNPLARQFRDEKTIADAKIETLLNEKNELLEELGGLRLKLTSHKKVKSEYEKNFNLVETDKKKYDVTQKLLIKINDLIKRIKEDKKYSLQKSISLGLKNLMHKEDFISNVRVNIIDDVMDIDLLDKNGAVIDKDSLSKGEQQLYATALLKALVDESGIKFPVFIDSPLQKFDSEHAENIITKFYPTISSQVVLLPLLEKELTFKEFKLMEQNVNAVYKILNEDYISNIEKVDKEKLFD